MSTQYLSAQRFSGQVAGTVTDITTNGPVRFIAIDIYNTTTTTAYLQIWALPSGSVQIGTTAPFLSIGVPGNAAGKPTVFALPIPVTLQGTGFSAAGCTTRTGSSAAALDINVIY